MAEASRTCTIEVKFEAFLIDNWSLHDGHGKNTEYNFSLFDILNFKELLDVLEDFQNTTNTLMNHLSYTKQLQWLSKLIK